MDKVARELRDYCYDETEMCEFLGGSRGPISNGTLRGRIYRRKKIPPFIKNGTDYWFPRDLYADWLRAQPVTFEVKSA